MLLFLFTYQYREIRGKNTIMKQYSSVYYTFKSIENAQNTLDEDFAHHIQNNLSL